MDTPPATTRDLNQRYSASIQCGGIIGPPVKDQLFMGHAATKPVFGASDSDIQIRLLSYGD